MADTRREAKYGRTSPSSATNLVSGTLLAIPRAISCSIILAGPRRYVPVGKTLAVLTDGADGSTMAIKVASRSPKN